MIEPPAPTFASEKPAPRILVVDDEVSIRLGCVMTLRADGWEAVGEGSPRNALERVTRGGERYDVILLDYAMPELDGLAVAAALDPQARPPILLASAYADGAVALAALRLGIWDFQSKPLLPDELRRRARRLYGRAQEAEAEGAWLPRALCHCNRCDWAEASKVLQGWPEAERIEPAYLITGLLCQLAGDEAGATQAFQRARWRSDWHRNGVEMWVELARRLG